jgi:hypothetical protein
MQKQVDTPFAIWEGRLAHGNRTLRKVKIMRTKTMLLSALLGGLGSVSVMAQTNVYSLNAVGYINLTVYPGLNIITCPLITSPNNTIGTVLNNSNGALTGSQVFFYSTANGYTTGGTDTAKGVGTLFTQTTNADGWANAGTNVLAPGIACWFENNGSSNLTLTFVGTVPTGPITNVLVSGLNLVGSVVPMSGDLVTNSISALTNYNIGDQIYTYTPTNPAASQYSTFTSASGIFAGHGYSNQWTSAGDPIVTNVGQGFWYDNNKGVTVNWVENYSVAQ